MGIFTFKKTIFKNKNKKKKKKKKKKKNKKKKKKKKKSSHFLKKLIKMEILIEKNIKKS